MGWAARLPKDQKEPFVRTCNKCGNTGYKKTFIATDGQPLAAPLKIKCKCTIQAEEAAKLVEAAKKAQAEEAAKNAVVVE